GGGARCDGIGRGGPALRAPLRAGNLVREACRLWSAHHRRRGAGGAARGHSRRSGHLQHRRGRQGGLDRESALGIGLRSGVPAEGLIRPAGPATSRRMNVPIRTPDSPSEAKTPLGNEVARRRTFAIISHPDAGKTTLTEKLLLFGGAIQLAGQVKAKRERRTTRSDWMA